MNVMTLKGFSPWLVRSIAAFGFFAVPVSAIAGTESIAQSAAAARREWLDLAFIVVSWGLLMIFRFAIMSVFAAATNDER